MLTFKVVKFYPPTKLEDITSEFNRKYNYEDTYGVFLTSTYIK